MVRIEEIGNIYTVSHNGLRYTVTVSQDPESYEFYRTIGLDVFEKDEKEVIKEKLDKIGVSYRANTSLKKLKELYASNTESDSKHESDLNTEGEHDPE